MTHTNTPGSVSRLHTPFLKILFLPLIPLPCFQFQVSHVPMFMPTTICNEIQQVLYGVLVDHCSFVSEFFKWIVDRVFIRLQRVYFGSVSFALSGDTYMESQGHIDLGQRTICSECYGSGFVLAVIFEEEEEEEEEQEHYSTVCS